MRRDVRPVGVVTVAFPQGRRSSDNRVKVVNESQRVRKVLWEPKQYGSGMILIRCEGSAEVKGSEGCCLCRRKSVFTVHVDRVPL